MIAEPTAERARSRRGLNDAFVRHLAAAPPLTGAIERLRALRALPSPKPGTYALAETTAAARPAAFAALHRALGGVVLVIVPTADAAERAFADLLYYLGEDEPQTAALLRSRAETVGAIEGPSERSARMTLLADLAGGLPRIVLGADCGNPAIRDAARDVRSVDVLAACRHGCGLAGDARTAS